MTDIDNSTDSNHLSQLNDASDEIARAQALLEAAEMIIEHIDRPDLRRTLNAVQTVLNTAFGELDTARRKVDALCDKCRSPKEKAGRQAPASAKH